MNNYKVGTRLLSGFGLVLLLMVVVGVMSLWRLNVNTNATEEINGPRLTIERLLAEWKVHNQTNQVRTLTLPYIDNLRQKDLIQREMNEVSAEVTKIQEQIQGMLVSPEAIALFNTISSTREAYRQARNEALRDPVRSARFFEHDAKRLLDDYNRATDALLSFQHLNQRPSGYEPVNSLFTLMYLNAHHI